jgi:hypothetical protein
MVSAIDRRVMDWRRMTRSSWISYLKRPMGARIARAISHVYDTVRVDRCPTRRRILIRPHTSTNINAITDSPQRPLSDGFGTSSQMPVMRT